MNTDKLREAIKEVDSGLSYNPVDTLTPYGEALKTLVNFSNHFLSSPSELPKRKNDDISRDSDGTYENKGFNSALDIAEQVVAKKNMRIEELEDALQEIVKYADDYDYDEAYDIAKSALEGGGK